jgi:hypothetical protein
MSDFLGEVFRSVYSNDLDEKSIIHDLSLYLVSHWLV